MSDYFKTFEISYNKITIFLPFWGAGPTVSPWVKYFETFIIEQKKPEALKYNAINKIKVLAIV